MQNLREVTRLSLARGLRQCSEEDRLALALSAVCGSAMSAHVTVIGLDEHRRLHMEIDTPEWMQSFVGMRQMLQHDLQRTAGVTLTGLHFELAGKRVGEGKSLMRRSR